MPSGHDTMGGNRFSEKILLKHKELDHDPIQSNRIMI
jgi:hypothetical protein